MSVFYGVHKGRSTGVFTDWDTVQKMVVGVSGPIYKKFKTRAEAEHFFRNGTVLAPKKDPVIPVVFNDLTIFTDGSMSSKTKKCAIGVAFSKPYDAYNYSELLPEDTTNQLAELFAIAKALEILTTQIQETHAVVSVEIWTDSDYSVNCVTKWFKTWERNGWYTKNNDPVKYRRYIEYIHDRLEELGCTCKLRHIKELHLKSHQAAPTSGTYERTVWEGNKIADRLARSLTE